jgi:3-oxoacyl-[acyl-carrier-protein] synthase II
VGRKTCRAKTGPRVSSLGSDQRVALCSPGNLLASRIWPLYGRSSVVTRRRVVVTGMGLRSPIGNTVAELVNSLEVGRSGIRLMPEWAAMEGMRTRLAGVVEEGVDASQIPRNYRRSMGRVGILSALAAQDAWKDAGLGPAELHSPRAGVAYGSTAGSVKSEQEFVTQVLLQRSLVGMQSSHYLQFMTHTCAANLAVFAGVQGPVVATCSACTSGSQGVGVGYEQVAFGRADIMLTGGAEEMHVMSGAVFDIMRATSVKLDPDASPRPFDAERDGLVVSEGAGCLVLEELEHAKRRGARVYAEVAGYGTSSNGTHMTNSDPEGIALAIRLALEDAGLGPERIQYVNAHATATDIGDRAEAIGMQQVLGGKVPVSSLKGHIGHTLGASGAIESIATIAMLRLGFIANTRNLDCPDPTLPPLLHVTKEPRPARLDVVMNNNFAFGGINTSLIFRSI